jgi:hypothetical protein
MRFVVSETVFNNAEIILDWVRHFNKYSFSTYAKFQRRTITMEEWFGCNENYYNS